MTTGAFVLSAGEMAAAFGGSLEGGAGTRPLRTVSIDTRTLRPGDLFVAIRGPRFDGHAFVDQALAHGAAGIVVSESRAAAPPETVVIVVDDTLRGLQDAARVIRRRAGTRLVGITGSAGKTTTKEIAASLLARRYTTYRNPGNMNNQIGVPLSLFELHAAPEMGVVELGMSGAGEIRRLVQIAEPELRVWTNVGDAHLGFFASVDEIADAKAEILEEAGPDHVCVANAGDPRVMVRTQGFAGRVVTFGVGVAADVTMTDIRERGLGGMAATLEAGGSSHAIETRLLGTANLANIAAAAAVAVECGVPLSEIVETIAALTPAAHRGQVVAAQGGWTLIDDAYNSSPDALTRALQMLVTAPGRHIAVIGEMLELGKHSVERHTACGTDVARLGVDEVIAVGGAPARALADAAVAGGRPAARVHLVADSTGAAALAQAIVRPGDTVLVKGSRGTRMEAVVQSLLGGGD